MRDNTIKRRGHVWSLESLENRALLANPTVIDIMVVYDSNAKSKLNADDAGIQRLIRQSIDTANEAHFNTGDNVVLRLVYSGQVNYTSTGSLVDDLNNLDSGQIPTVDSLRNQYGADLVSLITTGNFAGGFANRLIDPLGDSTQAFSVISTTDIGAGNFVLARLTGHNLGAGHEADDPDDPPINPIFPFALGYHFTAGPQNNTYADVMSTQGLTLPYYSNPNITYLGAPLGQPAGTDNAADLYSTFLQTAPVAAAYEPTVVPDTTAPTAAIYQEDLKDNTVTFKVRYQDDISVRASSIASGNVSIHTPEGLVLQAELVSNDAAGDGYAEIATYRATLPNSKPPLSSLTFFLNANQIQDTSGHFTPAGQISLNHDFSINQFEYQSARDTGALLPPQTRQLTGHLSPSDHQDLFRFTITQHSAFNAILSGLGSSMHMFLEQDLNGNDQPDEATETITATSEVGTVDRSMSAVLDPGTYFLRVQLDQGQTPSDYTVTVRNYIDLIPPTATLDAPDTTVPTKQISFSVLYSDDQALDFDSVRFDGLISYNYSYAAGGVNGHTGSPASATLLPNGQIVANYIITVGSVNLPNGTVTLSVYSGAQVQDAYGNALPTGTVLGTFKLAGNPVTTDLVAPTRTLSSAPQVILGGGTSYDFVVAYQDNRGINASTMDSNDIVVTGPGGFSQPAQFIGSTTSPGGSTVNATYRITPPGGSWDYHDDGIYSIVLQAGQVTDTNTNPVGPSGAANPVGTFKIHVAFPGDANGDDATGFADLVTVAQNYGKYGKGQASGDFNFDGVVNFADLVIVAQNYGGSIPPIPGAPVLLPQASLAALTSTVKTIAPQSAAISKPQAIGKKPVPIAAPKKPLAPSLPPPRVALFSTSFIVRNKNTLLA